MLCFPLRVRTILCLRLGRRLGRSWERLVPAWLRFAICDEYGYRGRKQNNRGPRDMEKLWVPKERLLCVKITKTRMCCL